MTSPNEIYDPLIKSQMLFTRTDQYILMLADQVAWKLVKIYYSKDYKVQTL